VTHEPHIIRGTRTRSIALALEMAGDGQRELVQLCIHNEAASECGICPRPDTLSVQTSSGGVSGHKHLPMRVVQASNGAAARNVIDLRTPPATVDPRIPPAVVNLITPPPCVDLITPPDAEYLESRLFIDRKRSAVNTSSEVCVACRVAHCNAPIHVHLSQYPHIDTHRSLVPPPPCAQAQFVANAQVTSGKRLAYLSLSDDRAGPRSRGTGHTSAQSMRNIGGPSKV